MSYPSGHRVLHLGLHFRKGPTKVAELEPLLNEADDWYRYAPNCWLLWTTDTAQAWYQALKPLIGDDNYILVIEVVPKHSFGWLPKVAWEWIKKYTPR